MLSVVVIGGVMVSLPKAQQVQKTKTGSASIPLQDLGKEASSLDTGQLSVNGQLNVNNGLVLKPSKRPETPTKGQTYLDEGDGQVYYYTGTTWSSFGAPTGSETLKPRVDALDTQATLTTAQLEDLTAALATKVSLQQTIGIAQNGNIVVTGTIVGGNFQGSGINLGDLNASNITVGTIDSNRLAPNVALLDRPAQSFTSPLGVGVAPGANGAKLFVGGALQFTASVLPTATPALNGKIGRAHV